MLTCWQIESKAQGGEKRVAIQVIATKRDGTRVPAAEKQVEYYFGQLPCLPALSLDERRKMLADVVEPALQRELKLRGAANGNGSYAAELIAYLELA